MTVSLHQLLEHAQQKFERRHKIDGGTLLLTTLDLMRDACGQLASLAVHSHDSEVAQLLVIVATAITHMQATMHVMS